MLRKVTTQDQSSMKRKVTTYYQSSMGVGEQLLHKIKQNWYAESSGLLHKIKAQWGERKVTI
jgi:hypothetical protein